MLDEIVFPGPGLSGVLGDFSHRVKLVKAGKDQFFLFEGSSFKLNLINLQVDKTLDDLKSAIPGKNFFPKIACPVPVTGRIALVVIMALVKRQPECLVAVQFRCHVHFIGINGKMDQGPFLEGEKQFPVIPCGCILPLGVLGCLPGELVFQLKGCHRQAVHRCHEWRQSTPPRNPCTSDTASYERLKDEG